MNNQSTSSPRKIAETKYNSARKNLLLMMLLTVINIVFLFLGTDTMLLFSATVPYYAVAIGYYLEIQAFLAVGLAVAAVSMILYLLCWIFSKKNYGWMIFALVLFILDSICLAGMYILIKDASGIFDALIHVWILYYLIIGVSNGHRLRTLPAEEEIQDGNVSEQDEQYVQNSTPLRRADEEIKHRVLLEGEELGHRICYRRVKRVNELVIDGYVYAQTEMLVEIPHELAARLNGRAIAVGLMASGFSYLSIDGNVVKKKLRLF